MTGVIARGLPLPEQIESLREIDTDVIVLDPYVNGEFRLEAISGARAVWPLARLVILTEWMDDESVATVFSRGADSYILKSEPAETIRAGLEFICRGGASFSPPVVAALAGRPEAAAVTRSPPDGLARRLTFREMEVLQLVARGFTDSKIARQLGISARTAQRHMTNILNKLNCKSRSQAVAQILGGPATSASGKPIVRSANAESA